MELHYDILDERRRALLPFFADLKTESFYLAGGTALAFILGHRDSIDFDFFRDEQFKTGELFERLKHLFENHTLVKTQDEEGTLSILIDGDIRASFFRYPYPLVRPQIESEYFRIASLQDIACMKLSAITSRTAFKDYVDLYYILGTITLKDIIVALRQKMPDLDPLLALKSLVYFDDLREESLAFKAAPVSLSDIRTRLTGAVRDYPANVS